MALSGFYILERKTYKGKEWYSSEFLLTTVKFYEHDKDILKQNQLPGNQKEECY